METTLELAQVVDPLHLVKVRELAQRFLLSGENLFGPSQHHEDFYVVVTACMTPEQLRADQTLTALHDTLGVDIGAMINASEEAHAEAGYLLGLCVGLAFARLTGGAR